MFTAAMVLLAAFSAIAQESVDDGFTVTTLRALDKVTARISEIELVENEEVGFGSLFITVRTCSTRPPEEPPETFAFLEIEENGTDGTRQRLFSGWMMASSPALNALDHAIYDVWVISCTIRSGDASAGSE